MSLSLFQVPTAALRQEACGPWALSPGSINDLDDIIATMPDLHSWKPARKGHGRNSLAGPARQQYEDGSDGINDENDEALDQEEGWTTVVAKKKRGYSMCSAGGKMRSSRDRRSL
jgi:hypothetical protein